MRNLQPLVEIVGLALGVALITAVFMYTPRPLLVGTVLIAVGAVFVWLGLRFVVAGTQGLAAAWRRWRELRRNQL